MPTPLALTDLVDHAALARAKQALELSPTVVLLEAGNFVASLAASWIVAELLPTAQSRLSDARIVAPDKTNWTVDEITEQIIAPANLTPRLRNVIVVEDADKMTAAAADHLLKVIEEPPSPTTFVLCTPSADLLSVTIRSRSSAKINFPLNLTALGNRLEETGLPGDVVKEAIDHLGENAALLDGLAGTPPLAREFLALVTTLPDSPRPVATALEAVATLEAVAKVATLPDGEDNDAARRRRTRRLASDLLAARATLLASSAALGADPDDVASQLRSLALAGDVLERNGSVELALAVAHLRA